MKVQRYYRIGARVRVFGAFYLEHEVLQLDGVLGTIIRRKQDGLSFWYSVAFDAQPGVSPESRIASLIHWRQLKRIKVCKKNAPSPAASVCGESPCVPRRKLARLIRASASDLKMGFTPEVALRNLAVRLEFLPEQPLGEAKETK